MAVTGMNFTLIYVDKLEPSQKFYEKYLGFEKKQEFKPGEIFGDLGSIQCWMGEGYEKVDTNDKSTRATVMLNVDSVGELFSALKDGGEKVIQDEPVEMKEGTFWMQFCDPAGNVLDVLGGK